MIAPSYDFPERLRLLDEYAGEYDRLKVSRPQLTETMSFDAYAQFSMTYHSMSELEKLTRDIDSKLFWLDSKIDDIKNLMPE